jgi:catechol 2,3-dioxygenase-like lactoylglutathione lyase family enzyme
MASRTLKDLSIVTYCVDDLDASRNAWIEHLGYQVADEGWLSPTLASAWQTSKAGGLKYCLLAPASGEAVYIRYIETGERRGFESSATRGWTATELLVQDPDALAMALRDSPFRRIAGPGNLFPGPKAPRAMQMVGPCGELLYFTRILPGGSRYGMKQARCRVDRPFIVTIAGDSMAQMQAFYGDALGMRVMEPMDFINGILAHSCGAPPDTIFPTAVSPIPGRRFLVEMDEFPPGLPPRPRQADQLPPGLAMVSFRVAGLDELAVPLAGPPARIDAFPYDGCRTALIRGAADEWLELIEGEPTI